MYISFALEMRKKTKTTANAALNVMCNRALFITSTKNLLILIFLMNELI